MLNNRAISLYIDAEDAAALLAQLRTLAGASIVPVPAPLHRTDLHAPSGGAPAALPVAASVGPDLSAVPYETLLNEVMTRAAARGFALTLTQMDAASVEDTTAPGRVSAPDRVSVQDVSGDAEGTDAPADDADDEGDDKAAALPASTSASGEMTDEAMLEAAIQRMMTVYARGKAGREATTRLREQYGVKKFSDVPLSQAGELLAAANALVLSIPAPPGKAGAEDAG